MVKIKNNLKQRVEEYCVAKHITVSEFERNSGLSNGHFKATTKTILPDKLEKILAFYPDMDVLYLLTGMRNPGTGAEFEKRLREAEEEAERYRGKFEDMVERNAKLTDELLRLNASARQRANGGVGEKTA